MGTLWQDVRYGCRMLLRYPGSTQMVIATMALVIGVMTLALGVYQQTQSAWLPFPNADRLVRFWLVGANRPSDRLPASVYAEAARSLRGLESIAAVDGYQPFVLTDAGDPKSLTGSRVSASVFDVLGASPCLGRTFSAEEVQSGQHQLVVLSHRFWQEAFAGERSILGRTVRLNDAPYAVVGVMPAGLDRSVLFYGVDLWLPADFELPAQDGRWVQVIGRSRRDISLSSLRAESEAVLTPVFQSHMKASALPPASARVSALPLGKQFGGIQVGEVVFVVAIPALMGAIACLNIMNILLGRMASRRREIAVRFSLGAGHARLVRQLLTESVLLAGCGGAVGAVGALWSSGWLATRGLETQFGPSVLVAVCAGTVLLGLAVGWLPAWRAAGSRLVISLKDGGGASEGIERHRLRNCLVTGQLAIATALCITAGLLVRSYLNKTHFDPGFDTKDVLEIGVSPRANVYGPPQKRLLYCEQVLERLRAVPNIAQVAVSSTGCLDRNPFPMSFRREGDGGQWRQGQTVRLSVVSPNYLKMVNLPVMRGRPLTDDDRSGSDPVLLVNESFVTGFLANVNPIGCRIELPVAEQPSWFTIVGVVPNRRSLGPQENIGPEAYLSARQVASPWVSYTFLIRTRTQPAALLPVLRETIRSVDYDQPVSGADIVQTKLRRAVQRDRTGAQIMTLIGLFGLVMAVLGTYGVVSHSVVERTHELGVRAALGSGSADVLVLILGQGLKLTVFGLAGGVVLAMATTFGISQMLFGIRPVDPVCYLVVCVILAATVISASLIPARRAARIDPMVALRYE